LVSGKPCTGEAEHQKKCQAKPAAQLAGVDDIYKSKEIKKPPLEEPSREKGR